MRLTKAKMAKARRQRIDAGDLVLRQFEPGDLDSFVAGLEGQATPVDEFDWFATLDAARKTGRGMSRARVFAALLDSQKTATIYANPGFRLQLFGKDGGEWMGYVAIYDARWNVLSAALDY